MLLSCFCIGTFCCMDFRAGNAFTLGILPDFDQISTISPATRAEFRQYFVGKALPTKQPGQFIDYNKRQARKPPNQPESQIDAAGPRLGICATECCTIAV